MLCARDHYSLDLILGEVFKDAGCVVKVLLFADGAGWDMPVRELKFTRVVTLY